MLTSEYQIFVETFNFRSDFLLRYKGGKLDQILEEMYEEIGFKRGDKLFYEDGVPTGVYFLKSGRAKKYKTLFDKNEQIFYVYHSGDLMGYHALLSNERYQDTCELMDDSVVQFLSKENFLKLLQEYPELKDLLIDNLAHEFNALANIIGVLAQKSQTKRLGINLLILHHRFRSEAEGIDINRNDLANIVGTTKESLSRSLRELKDLQLITIKKKVIFVSDEIKLYQYCM